MESPEELIGLNVALVSGLEGHLSDVWVWLA